MSHPEPAALGTAGRPRWWIDAGAGASGDMLLGALLALDPNGLAPAQEAVDEVLTRLGPQRVRLEVAPTHRAGMAATQARVHCDDDANARTWQVIRPALADLPHARAVFSLLADAEGHVHGVPAADIHFHEVGALDAIADIVAVATLWARLEPTAVVVSPVCVGSGTVTTTHGALSVPVPAVTQLLRGVPTFAGDAPHEACTPTGAALLRYFATDWGFQPLMSVDQVGVGAGGRDLPDAPNVLRILSASRQEAPSEHLVLVETTIDDLDPRVYPDVLSRTKQAGALETWLSPVIMKHGRPGVVVTALCVPSATNEVTAVLFRETPTLGIRYTQVRRQALQRDFVVVQVRGHTLEVKRGWLDGTPITIQPEYQQAVEVSAATGMPIRQVLDEARGLAAKA